jgi:hypothetical protein
LIFLQVSSLASSNEDLRGELASLRLFLLIVLAVVCLILVVLLWRTNNLAAICPATMAATTTGLPGG